MALSIEEYIPGIRENGLLTSETTTLNGATTLAGAVTVTGATTYSNTITGQQKVVVNVNAASGTSPTLTNAQSGSLIVISSTTGTHINLPNPTPTTGVNYTFVVLPNVLASGSYGISTGTSTVFLTGTITVGAANGTTAGTFVGDGATAVSVRLNGTTTGGSSGTILYVSCVSATEWLIQGTTCGSGVIATPFSAVV